MPPVEFRDLFVVVVGEPTDGALQHEDTREKLLGRGIPWSFASEPWRIWGDRWKIWVVLWVTERVLH